jgi:prophage regulatory protein
MGMTHTDIDQGSEGAATRVETNRRIRPAAVSLRLLRFGEVRQRTGLSRSTIWRMERSGSFPSRIKVSINVVAWREDEVSEWIARKIQGRERH